MTPFASPVDAGLRWRSRHRSAKVLASRPSNIQSGPKSHRAEAGECKVQEEEGEVAPAEVGIGHEHEDLGVGDQNCAGADVNGKD